MEQFEKNNKNKIVRGAKRATYDKQQIFSILDAGCICHISFVINGEPFIIPTAYGRDGEFIYVHGSIKSRTMKAMTKGVPVCMAVTHLDGLVLARSAFHHSANYRSVILFGTAKQVESNTDKNHGLFVITENILKGRWEECRLPSQKELDITAVLKFKIESASAKIRTGGPVDEQDDYALDVWAGELPIITKYASPVADEKLRADIAVSNAAILAWQNANG
ncbi:pyridoxamine 5'-phosphate oxidase family protein [Reichenbachiella carrageenanivorans]|uniref:Pyridoxamine 5'-phosphate oxidase family protein n=1 Tax=Reichenbachiella carrageenanivorans TaxID=2979869 RepID=A0ABY6CXT2_9BACT|nr:pyridoxamine 5'-phosphate oxidase family protein [Reichenbachiella carrageenanivorans]UXX78734.1 pyridoxamine 5'-phosphate oxidase family protein [Reichenbachiella carrageenanivorans]